MIKIKKEIKSFDDIKLLVDTFYSEIRENSLLAPIFNNKIKNNWPNHLGKMYRFWQTVLLYEHTYKGSPFPPHNNLSVDKIHFTEWINIFTKTVNDLFEGEIAEKAIKQSEKMAIMFQSKIEYNRNNLKMDNKIM